MPRRHCHMAPQICGALWRLLQCESLPTISCSGANCSRGRAHHATALSSAKSLFMILLLAEILAFNAAYQKSASSKSPETSCHLRGHIELLACPRPFARPRCAPLARSSPSRHPAIEVADRPPDACLKRLRAVHVAPRTKDRTASLGSPRNRFIAPTPSSPSAQPMYPRRTTSPSSVCQCPSPTQRERAPCARHRPVACRSACRIWCP